MGSGLSQDTSTTGTFQETLGTSITTSKRKNTTGKSKRSEDEELLHRPNKRLRTSSSNCDNHLSRDNCEERVTSNSSDSITMKNSSHEEINDNEDFQAIHNDLEEVERGLSACSRGGIALFESFGSALGNIRERLHNLTRGFNDTSSSVSATAGVASSASAASASHPISTRNESLRALSQRLDTAELSHSTRMPLDLLQSELSRRDLSMEVDDAPSTPNQRNRRSDFQRRPSELLASRSLDEITSESPDESPTVAVSFASVRSLAASHRSALPTLQESSSLVEEASIEISLEEQNESDSDIFGKNEDRGLLLPDSARSRKLRASMRGSIRILGDDVVRNLADEATETKHNVEFADIDGSSISSPTIPVVGIYTWGSLEILTSDNENSDDKEDPIYKLFGAPEKEKSVLSPRLLPQDTRLGRADIVSMSASENQCAFVTAAGGLLTCGNNREGAVDPARRDVLYIPQPTRLETGLASRRIKKVACGANHTAVITENKSVLTWGMNDQGQLGHRKAKRSDNFNFVRPKVFVIGKGGRRADNVVSCKGYTLVLTTRMEAYVCGGESLSPPESHDPIKEDSALFPLPEQNPVLCGLPLVGIASGPRHLVVWTAHGTAYAWGSNDSGQCGREFPRELKVPVPILVPKSTQTYVDNNYSVPKSPFMRNWNIWEQGEPMSLANDVHVVDAACGKDHTILVTDSGRLLVCGSNKNGQLGVETNPDSTTSFNTQPVVHPTPERQFQSVEAGTNHTVLLDDIGQVWQMGNGESSISQVPSLLKSESQICSIMAGGSINFCISKSKSAKAPCAPIISMPELDELMSAIRSEHDQNKESDKQEETKNYLSSIEDLAKGTENLFRSPAVMNSLFVDPKEIDHMYQTLIHGSHTKEMKQRIVSSIERGMKMGLNSMADSRLIYFESVRFLLLYLQCPLWREKRSNKMDEEEKEESEENKTTEEGEEESKEDEKEESQIVFDKRGDLLFLLCETILGLPFEGYKAFLFWSATVYGEELFVPLLIEPLVQQLNYRFLNNITHGIPMIAGVLRWLHTVNERSDMALARGQDFYCAGIDDMPMEALYDDLIKHQMSSECQRSSNFFLAANPFLMAPAMKHKLLQVENQMLMVKAAQAAGVSFDSQTREFKFQPYFVLSIDRKFLLQQTLNVVAKAKKGQLRKGLKVVFKGEDGVDAGGVTKELFQLLCEHLFDVNTGMWTTNFGNNQETWFNSICTWNSEGYYLVGVLCGLAVYNSVILDVHFPHAIYRKLLGKPLGLEDLIDEDVRKGLKSLLDYEGDDAEYVFCLNFEVTWMDLGQERKKELKPGGSDIAVTSENKEEYVRLYVKWLLVDSIAPQYDEFERGFNQVMEDSSLDILLAEELELLVAGTPELDFSALEKASEYEGGFDRDSAVVKNIWKWIQSETIPTQEKFLKFCTGSSKGPIGGLGKMAFKIQRAGPDSQQLPTAHTCFNTLIVPDYGDDYDKLSDRLGRAVIECEGFGLQ